MDPITTIGLAAAGMIYHFISKVIEERKAKEEESKTMIPLLDQVYSIYYDKEKQKSSNICAIEHLSSYFPEEEIPKIRNPLLRKFNYNAFVNSGSFVIGMPIYNNPQELTTSIRYFKAGPKRSIYFHPEEVRACIVNCGGLCPGLNVVIREIVMALYYSYKVNIVYGVKWGYEGFLKEENWLELKPEIVKDIHRQGGTILGSSRGGFYGDKIVDKLIEKKINQLYVIGGDGTHRGILELSKILDARKAKIALSGIPKTIDNDIAIIDESFGFRTAVDVAVKAIEAANVEAICAENGVGLVKLMGRDAGFIAMHACLANRDVNVCLVKEFPFNVYGEFGVCEYICKKLKEKGHCVVVVSEGASEGVLDYKFQGERAKDASGNVQFPDIGGFLKTEIVKYGKEKKINITLKYIDPTYMIRAIPANSYDKQLCSVLAFNAVHAAMAGYTKFTIGLVRTQSVLFPIKHIVEQPKRHILETDREWQRLLASTGQPRYFSEKKNIS